MATVVEGDPKAPFSISTIGEHSTHLVNEQVLISSL